MTNQPKDLLLDSIKRVEHTVMSREKQLLPEVVHPLSSEFGPPIPLRMISYK